MSDDGVRSVRGVDTDRYESSIYGRAAASDGYMRDAYSDQYEEMGGVYGLRGVKGKGYSKGYKQPAIGYGGQYDKQSKSYENLKEPEYKEERTKVAKYQREDRIYRPESRDRYREDSRDAPRSSRRARSPSPSESESEEEDEEKGHGDENTEVMKWGATLAGAAIGGFTGHKARKDGFVGTAIGAIVGGIVAREAEKEIYKRRTRNKSRRREEDESYRSKSR